MLKQHTLKKINSKSTSRSKTFISKADGNAVSYEVFDLKVTETTLKLKAILNEISNQPIGLLSTKNTDCISLVFSIIQTRNFYVPIPPFLSMERISQIIKLTSLNYFIIEKAFLNGIESHFSIEKIPYSIHKIDGNYLILKLNQKPKVYPENSLYCLFTSGSTGFSKGIIHSKSSLNAFIDWCKKEFDIFKVKRIVSITPLHFDLSTFDIFYTYQTKKTLCLTTEQDIFYPKLFLKEIEKLQVDCLYATPTFFDLLLTFGSISKADLSKVKLLLIAGEPLKTKLCDDLLIHFKKATIYNLYGPTETNVCSYHQYNPKKPYGKDVPIGKSCYKNTLSISKIMELQYNGKTLMSAYINEKGKCITIKPKTVYKTGDFIVNSKRQIFFEKRKDKLVKKNGFRVNLLEINHVLIAHSNIAKAHVFMNKNNNIIAVVMASEKLINEMNLREFCQKHLPYYAVPNQFIYLDTFPYNSNYKLDIQKLQSYHD